MHLCSNIKGASYSQHTVNEHNYEATPSNLHTQVCSVRLSQVSQMKHLAKFILEPET